MKTYKSDKKARNILLIFSFAIMVILGIILYRFRGFLGVVILKIILVVIGIVYVAFFCVMLPLWFRVAEYNFDDKQIVISLGFITNSKYVIKVKSIQHIVLITTPLSKVTGLNFLSINLLGGVVFVPFLKYEDAFEIKEMFKTVLK